MEIKIYQIWMEGFAATGQSGKATKIGEIEATSFDEAVEKFLETDKGKSHKALYRKSEYSGMHLIWGCQLFDNEKDARKDFG